MQTFDLFLVAGLDVSEHALPFDGAGGTALPRLVGYALRLPYSDREQLCEFAQLLPLMPTSTALRWVCCRPATGTPPGFGSLFVRMMALCIMGWLASAHVLREISGVSLAASTIGAIGRGVRGLDAERVIGLAAVLAIPAGVLEKLTGVDPEIGDQMHSSQSRDVAA